MEIFKPKVSVLMSIYNETESEILDSVWSIIKQTYEAWELLIVNDNPNSLVYDGILSRVQKLDSRIRIIKNDHNMGLALSMNKAAKESKTDLLARMDADDIAETTRLENQIPYLLDEGYDFVCGRYIKIDEKGRLLYDGELSEFFDENTLSSLLPLKSTIHHPTVIMTKEIFNKAGMYRDFPCTQDYDLWLRMHYLGARMVMANCCVLQYRVRETSVTIKHLVKQQFTKQYIRKLYIRRIIRGMDDYSKSNYVKYLKKYIKNESVDNAIMHKGNEIITKATKMIESGHKLKGYFLKYSTIITNRIYRIVYFNLVVDMVKIKIYEK